MIFNTDPPVVHTQHKSKRIRSRVGECIGRGRSIGYTAASGRSPITRCRYLRWATIIHIFNIAESRPPMMEPADIVRELYGCFLWRGGGVPSVFIGGVRVRTASVFRLLKKKNLLEQTKIFACSLRDAFPICGYRKLAPVSRGKKAIGSAMRWIGTYQFFFLFLLV